ncbi:TPA: sodium:proton antiporter [bacterium]|nr:MAG: hypothetical protein AUJ18_09650 [Candidatus Hydrogenedentes bacterium CG1_02_42_14]HBW46782.1 sodium:proton antiporter [bacterium]
MIKRNCLRIFTILSLIFIVGNIAVLAQENQESLGNELGWWTVFPFVGLLLCIAILPLAFPHWWEPNRNKAIVAAIFGVPMALYMGYLDYHLVLHTASEYFSFIVLLTSLFAVSGGIFLTGNLVGRPITNLFFLIVGAILANLVGTTGASMILIRPLIRANSERKHTLHIFVFFIFVVSNCGGLLTPLGDPPLFLGFLRGVPFFWTLRLLPQWLLCLFLVLSTFMFLELRSFKKETQITRKEDIADYVPLGISGKINFLYLVGIMISVFLPGMMREAEVDGKLISGWGIPWREIGMIAMILCSMKLAPSGPRIANKFTFNAMQEVGYLFAGIFAAMMPALEILKARGGELGLSQPYQFFWASGILSSFLDNAPTYLTFASTALGYLGIDNLHVLALDPEKSIYLMAVSCGAVFMGANSYIGNAPNFMVKSICEESGIKMPSFFGYMLYSGLVLIPSFAIVTFVFFH